MRATRLIALSLVGFVGLIFGAWLLSRPPAAIPVEPLCPSIGKTSESEHIDIARIADRIESKYGHDPYLDGRVIDICRVDLDGDGEREAFVQMVTLSFCGSVGCDGFIVQWRNGVAHLVTETTGPGWYLDSWTNGWRDLEGKDYFYRWNGEFYDAECKPEFRCDEKG